MGNPTAEPPSNPHSITHFSHPHPLVLFNPQTSGQIPHCSACKLSASAAPAVYACVGCGFFLHPKCSQLPQQISHPFDEKHGLTLYPQPVYPEGLFNCDGCGHRGSGFSYHCSPCGVDLHTTCASLPIKLPHRLHLHPLTLTFSAPYAGNSFSCDICKKLGSKTWLYSCAACEFDVHLTCVATVVPPAAPPPQQQPQHTVARSFVPANQPMMPNYPPPNAGAFGAAPAQPPQFVGSGYPVGMPAPPPVVGSGYPVGMAPPPQQPQAYGHAVRPVYGGARPATPLKNQMAVAAVEGITGGIAQSATTALFQGLFGGGGSGGGGGGGVVVEGSAGYEQGVYIDEGGGAAAEEGYSGEDNCYNYI